MSVWQIAILVLMAPLPLLFIVLGGYAVTQLERETEAGMPYPVAGVVLLFVAGVFALLVRIVVGLAA